MESRTLSAVAVVLFAGILSHIASSQQINIVPVPCNVTTDCKHSLLPAEAQCISGFCTCIDQEGVVQSCQPSHSQPKAAVHNPVKTIACKLPQDCQQLANSICNTTVNQCVCAQGYVKASANLTCLPVARSLGSSCNQEDQCSFTNSTCRNGQCVCTAGFHYSENGCWRTAEIGTSCKFNQECSHVPDAVCNEQMICMCPDDSVLNSDRRRCLPVVRKMLGECVESVQCSKNFTNAECIEKRCECKENNHFEPSVAGCVSSKHLGDGCAEDYECYQDQVGGETEEPQKCIGSICTCNENFEKDGDKCVRSAASSLGPVVYMSLLLSALLFCRS